MAVVSSRKQHKHSYTRQPGLPPTSHPSTIQPLPGLPPSTPFHSLPWSFLPCTPLHFLPWSLPPSTPPHSSYLLTLPLPPAPTHLVVSSACPCDLTEQIPYCHQATQCGRQLREAGAGGPIHERPCHLEVVCRGIAAPGWQSPQVRTAGSYWQRGSGSIGGASCLVEHRCPVAHESSRVTISPSSALLSTTFPVPCHPPPTPEPGLGSPIPIPGGLCSL